MKKIFALMLALAMMLSLFACGGDKAEKKEETAPKTEVEDATVEPEIDATPADKSEFDIGVVSNDVYENKFAGLGFKLPSDWSFRGEEEIMKLNNITADVAGEDFKKMMAQANYIYDMVASDATGVNNINVVMEKAVNPAMIENFDVIENYETLTPALHEGLKNMGYTNISSETGTFLVGGKEMPGMKTQSEIYGNTMYQLGFGKLCGNYLISVTITADSEAKIDTITENIYWLD